MAIGNCNTIKRQLKIKNTTSIPVSVFWHVFFTNDEKENHPNFNIICHIKDVNKIEFLNTGSETNEKLKLLLTEYHGKEANDSILQVGFIKL